MNTVTKNFTSGKALLSAVFLVYLVLLGYTLEHHEMWGDEIHSWNIAKGSSSYPDLIHNTRYEGHPPVWYTILWTISRVTHNLEYVQMAHWLIAGMTVFMILFYSPLPVLTKILLPFGYYFLYEYAVLSRNYAIGILFACCICVLVRKTYRFKLLLYYLLLFLMTNTHLLVLILAGCIHLWFLFDRYEQTKDKMAIILHVVIGVLVFLPALYFIFPPSDSQLNTGYWINRWNPDHIKTLGQGPLRSFIPVPAWWEYQYWNTQFLLDASWKSKYMNLLIAILTLTTTIYILFNNKKSLGVFLVNLLLTFLVALMVFPLTSGRYAGFLFIGFVFALWLYCAENRLTTAKKNLVNFLLVLQLITGVFMVVKDVRLPFSNAFRVNEVLSTPPAGSRVVTDYWAMNTISAFADRSIYCIDIQREISFVLWGPELAAALKKPNRYYDGVRNIFEKEGLQEVYIVSTGSPQMLDRADPKLFKAFKVRLVKKIGGSVEKGGNLYLYQVMAI